MKNTLCHIHWNVGNTPATKHNPIELQQLEATRDELLEQEKYELLSELKEIYDKLKKEYDEL